MASTTSAAARRAGGRATESTEAFLDDARSPSNLAADAKRSSGKMAAKAGAVTDDAGHFFGREGAAPKVGRPPQPPPPPGGDELDTVVEDFEDYGSYDATTAFEPMDDLDREPTPALLAAKAEPLGGAPSSARPARRAPKSSRSKAGEAARVSKSRAKSRRKTKEPSKFWLGVGFLAVLLAGFATAYFLTRSGDTDSVASGDQEAAPSSTALTTDTSAADGQPAAVDTTTAESAPAAPTGAEPVVIFDEAAVGPIDAGVSYTIGVGEGPESAMYQLLVDNVPAADPAPELPPVTFTPGRHLLVIDITSPSGNIQTNPVLVYAVGEVPAPNWRANLSSVDIVNEGWAEAAKQFDEYVAAGHAELQLMPSERIPSLTPGYWNLYVGGFADSAAALAYCEQYGLTVPDDCFPKLADPSAPAGG